MTLEDLGYTTHLESYRKEHNLDSFGVGRVISEHKERYVVKTAESEYDSEIIGNLRYTASGRSDFPAVGDWVAISEYDEDKALIHAVFPRKTIIERQAVGQQGEKQIIATNIDVAFIVQAIDRDFSINRIERYLTLCHASRVEPIIILSKADLISDEELDQVMGVVLERIKHVQVISLSNETPDGTERLKGLIEKRKTYCLLGSSGVGKSTLLNRLSEKSLMHTDSISASSNRGRHVTTHRALHVLESGGMIIDNPGMREVGMIDSDGGLELTFEAIKELSKECKFKDCTHTSETGCKVLEALEGGELDKSSYENYQKMEREKEHFESTIAEKRRKDKDFGKMIKSFKKLKSR